MPDVLRFLVGIAIDLVRGRAALVAENALLRQQLIVAERKLGGRVRWTPWQRCTMGLAARFAPAWRSVVLLVQPATILRWHRAGFRLLWTWKSRRRAGRPSKDPEIRALVRRMASANPTWGAPRIHGELQKLGLDVSERTVARLMPRRRGPPSPTWRAFLDNHVKTLVAVDFFVVPTATFRVLFVFIVVALDRRRVLHFNATDCPSAAWTAQQIVQAFPDDSAPHYLVRDRDGIYGSYFRHRVRNLGIREVLTTARSPWQNCYAERMIGSVRRELLDHVIVLGERHLRRLLRSYFAYYHGSRTHLALAKDTPDPRAVEPPAIGRVVELAEVGGLHHRYVRRAA